MLLGHLSSSTCQFGKLLREGARFITLSKERCDKTEI